MPPAARRPLTLSAFLLIALTSGCQWSAEVTAPLEEPAADAASEGLRSAIGIAAAQSNDTGWYPLTVGNRWVFRGHSFAEITPPVGPAEVLTDTDFVLISDLICQESSGDARFVFERWTEIFSSGEISRVRRMRQTREGLWRTFASVDPPAECADAFASHGTALGSPAGRFVRQGHPQQAEIEAALARIERIQTDLGRALHTEGTPGPQEIETQLLAYPLRPGQTWMLGEPAGLTRMTVEAHEILQTPVGKIPAWRIRMDHPLRGPGSSIHVWYGRSGYLQFVSRSVDELSDGSILRADHTHFLETIQLAEPGRFSVASR